MRGASWRPPSSNSGRRSTRSAISRSTSSRSRSATRASSRLYAPWPSGWGSTARCRVDVDVAPAEALAERAQVTFYQLIRVALNQAAERRPSRISITVADDDDGGVRLTVADDGHPERRQNGIEELEERAQHLSGTVEVERDEAGHDDHGRASRVRGPKLGSAPKWRTSSSSGSRAATSCASARATRRPSATRSRRTRARMIVTKVAPSPLPADDRRCAYVQPV